MEDGSKAKKQLINELARLRRKLLKYEKSEAARKQDLKAPEIKHKKNNNTLHFEHQQLISIFDNIEEPVYVTDPDTYKILYANQSLKERFGDVVGKKCFRAFQGLKAPCTFCTNNRIFGKNTGKSYIWEFQNKIDQRWYRCIDKAIRWPNRKMVRYEMAIDITEQKKAKEALKNERYKLKEYFENLPLLAYNIGFDGRIQDCNNLVLKTLGYKTKKELIGKLVFTTIYAPSSRKKAKQLFLKWQKTGKLKNEELQIITKKGKVLDVLLNADTIYDKKGNPLFSISTHLDITELKRTEEALQENEELFSNIIESMSDGILVLDRNFHYTYWNRAMEKISKTPRKKLIKSQQSPWETFPHLVEQGVDNMMKKAMKGELIKKENIPYRLHDGTNGFTSEMYLPLRSATGEIRGIVGVVRDITERKKAEEALHTSRERLSRLFQGLPIGLYQSTPDGGRIDANPALMNMLDYPDMETFLSKNIIDSYVNPEDRIAWQAKIEKEGIIRGFEVQWRRYDGSIIWVRDSARAVKDSKGRVQYYEGAVEDITERKLTEGALRASLKEKEVLLREIHHRVKNNMQIMSSLLNLQSRLIKNTKVLDMFKASQGRIRSMAIIHEKLYLAKDLAGIDFSQYIRSLISHLFHSYKVDPNIIILNTDVENVTLDINTSIPCGLLINELVSNSLKHAFPKSKGWGKKGKSKGKILLSFRSDEKDQYMLIVRDNGVGFPKELDFRKTKSLGLQLVNDLVGQLNGSITLRRSGGTSFKITFKKPVYKPVA